MGLQGMHSMVLTLGNGHIWLGAPPVALQYILVFFHFVVCKCLFAKHLILLPTLGKWQNAF